mmetsp:Transcript_11908/g.39167  ORF Transcript_11908/g.39167 Transcript_11908/m.39167 type:complete len:340 (+) Transcript_11908:770-1789(+)
MVAVLEPCGAAAAFETTSDRRSVAWSAWTSFLRLMRRIRSAKAWSAPFCDPRKRLSISLYVAANALSLLLFSRGLRIKVVPRPWRCFSMSICPGKRFGKAVEFLGELRGESRSAEASLRTGGGACAAAMRSERHSSTRASRSFTGALDMSAWHTIAHSALWPSKSPSRTCSSHIRHIIIISGPRGLSVALSFSISDATASMSLLLPPATCSPEVEGWAHASRSDDRCAWRGSTCVVLVVALDVESSRIDITSIIVAEGGGVPSELGSLRRRSEGVFFVFVARCLQMVRCPRMERSFEVRLRGFGTASRSGGEEDDVLLALGPPKHVGDPARMESSLLSL